MFNHRAQKIKSIEDVQSEGSWIGAGSYGKAYKVSNLVYKIYYPDKDGWDNHAERSARYWNRAYQQIYNGKYKDQAIARHEKLLSKKYGVDHSVLITPFIKGKTIGSHKDLLRFNEEFKKPQVHLCMWDEAGTGNIRKNLSGDCLPIDFDLVTSLPDEVSGDTNIYNTPQSPMSKSLIQGWSDKKVVFRGNESCCSRGSKLYRLGLFALSITMIATAYVCQQESNIKNNMF